MPQLSFPAPATLNGDALAAEIRAATGLQRADVMLVDGRVEIGVSDDGAQREADIAAVVAAHTGQPTPEQQAVIIERTAADTALQSLRAFRQAGSAAFMAGTAAERDRAIYDRIVDITRVLADLRRQGTSS
jgi:hypothetical protein